MEGFPTLPMCRLRDRGDYQSQPIPILNYKLKGIFHLEETNILVSLKVLIHASCITKAIIHIENKP